MTEYNKPYKHQDFANMITKKERLILERNAELFPDGPSNIALQLYDTYESVKNKTVSNRCIITYTVS